MSETRRYLVTGAAGFIGSNLCEALHDRGDAVEGLDNFHPFYDPKIKRRNIAGLLETGEFVLHATDITDFDAISDRLAGNRWDAVIHLAALPGARDSVTHPLDYDRVNVGGTLNLLEAMRRHGPQRLVLASSSSVYGDEAQVPFIETEQNLQPLSPYAATKRAGELLCWTYRHLFQIQTVVLRYFSAYGPRQRPDLAIARFVDCIRRGQPIPVFGDGSARRDYTYIGDIVDGTIAALDYLMGADGPVWEIFNIGESRPLALNDVIAEIEKALGRAAVRDTLPARAGEMRETCANIDKARHMLGYRPSVSLEEGLRRYIASLEELDGDS